MHEIASLFHQRRRWRSCAQFLIKYTYDIYLIVLSSIYVLFIVDLEIKGVIQRQRDPMFSMAYFEVNVLQLDYLEFTMCCALFKDQCFVLCFMMYIEIDILWCIQGPLTPCYLCRIMFAVVHGRHVVYSLLVINKCTYTYIFMNLFLFFMDLIVTRHP